MWECMTLNHVTDLLHGVVALGDRLKAMLRFRDDFHIKKAMLLGDGVLGPKKELLHSM